MVTERIAALTLLFCCMYYHPAGAFRHPLFCQDDPDKIYGMVCKSRRGTKSSPAAGLKGRHQQAQQPGSHAVTTTPQVQERKQNRPLTVRFSPTLSQASPNESETTKLVQHSLEPSSSNKVDAATLQTPVVGQTPPGQHLIETLSKDKSLISAAEKQMQEAERRRTAKAMLYASFLKAL